MTADLMLPLAAVRLTGLTLWQALGIFALVAIPTVLLGWRSLAGLGATRKWVAIGMRLLVIALGVLILGNATWQGENKDVHLVVLRDVSDSTAQVTQFPGKNLEESVDQFLVDSLSPADKLLAKKPNDSIGVISFNNRAFVDSIASTNLTFGARAIRERGAGTDVSAAIQLGLATLKRDALHRMLLIWDGNQTTGDLETAVNAAVAAGVPIDVMPLKYSIGNEVLMDRFVAPTWKRENEPFSLQIVLRSTNPRPTPGKLTVLHQGLPMDLDPATPGVQSTRRVTLNPDQNVVTVNVPALQEAGVHQFKATFEADDAADQSGVAVSNPGGKSVQDTLAANNTASAFTFVRGKGKVLYVDNAAQGGGNILRDALIREGITLDMDRTTVANFPTTAVELQNYDAVILANVPRGPGGLSDDQGKQLASYVHDLGGGLVVIGGPEALGAGGWQGTRLEQILPVDLDIPAERMIAKGALALVMHSCEMPDGNYFGIQCAMKAVEVLNKRDEIGVCSYGWQGGGSIWDFPLAEKGDGSAVNAAIKNMALGDMPSFDDSMNLVLNGDGNKSGLLASNAKQKHIIIISDGDPQAPAANLIQTAKDNKISISTVTVYPHMGDPDGLPPTMKEMARATGGRAYGPINNNPNQLPQIFIKEATVVRKTLIQEDKKGFAVVALPSTSDAIKGLGGAVPGVVYGMVMTTKKQNPQVEMPLVVGAKRDPLLAHWQTGLGRSLVFTADAHNKWGTEWVASPVYDKFWAQVVRTVSRPAESSDFDVQVSTSGGKGKILVEAVNKNNQFRNGLALRGTVVGPDMKPMEVRLVQTAPGTYETDFPASDAGNYVVGLSYSGNDGQSGILRSGTVVNTSPELRDLKSNDAILQDIARRTGGRVIEPFAAATANLFSREGLRQTSAPKPIWDILLPCLIAGLLADVALRRIAWDWESVKKAGRGARNFVRRFTVTTGDTTSSTETLGALRKVRTGVTERQTVGVGVAAAKSTPARPDPKAKFEGKATEGDLSSIVGGATNQPLPPKPKPTSPPKGTSGGGGMSDLLEAKRRAQQQIREKEEGK